MQNKARIFFSMALICGLCLGAATLGMASEASVKAKLDAVAATLVQHASQNLLPKPSKKAVSQEDGYYVARYATIDTAHVSTQLMQGQHGGYVGTIKYTEQYFACRGASQAQALSAPCSLERTRKMTEIIAYTDGKWLYH